MRVKNIWFTSDWHLGHSNIIKYTNRPFKDIPQMNETILNNYIEIVKEEDEVYFIGDIFWGYDFEWQKGIYDLFPGFKYLVFGNHDKRKECKKIFNKTYSRLKLKEFTLIHNPYKYCKNGDFCICGHVHNKFKVRENKINVSVDVWNYKPVSLIEIRKLIRTF